MLARARGVPMVVGLGSIPAARANWRYWTASGGRSKSRHRKRGSPNGVAIWLRSPSAGRRGRLAEAPASDALRQGILALVNIQGSGDLTPEAAHADGVGLVRTEFLFEPGRAPPDEATQYEAYRRILEWAGARPVTIRTLDAGGDKPIPGVTFDGEANPFLGVRGLRLSLRRPDLFRTQLRALARAAVNGNLKVMLPMVTTPDELAEAREHLDAVMAELDSEGLPARRPALGIMVEVPAAALAIDRFDADFFSIGSNDLVQYVTACDRGAGELAALADPLNPAVLELIRRTIDHGREDRRPVSLCGDMAADPRCVPALVECGLEEFSVAPSALGRLKAAIARMRLRCAPRRDAPERRRIQGSSRPRRKAARRHACRQIAEAIGDNPAACRRRFQIPPTRCRYLLDMSRSSSRSVSFRAERAALRPIRGRSVLDWPCFQWPPGAGHHAYPSGPWEFGQIPPTGKFISDVVHRLVSLLVGKEDDRAGGAP